MFYKPSLWFLSLFLFSCGKRHSESEVNSRGKQLSEIHCKSCHLYTSPELLDRSSWIKVLSVMEREMTKASMQVENADWIEIQQYYLENSPLILPQPLSKEKIRASNLFRLTNLMDSIPGASPFVSMIKYDDERKALVIGDVSGDLLKFNHLEYEKKWRVGNTPIDLKFNRESNSLDVLGMGSFMPSDEKTGQLVNISDKEIKTIIIDSLERPVHFAREDFNNDGKEEYLVSCFGSTVGQVNSGKLALFTLDKEIYKEIVVKKLPGAIKATTGDFNNDKWPDIIALFAQGEEKISMFINQGDFNFVEKPLLEFIPVYGCNNFELADINEDSYPDIILTNGDNGDFSPVYKYYHGVRIFVNDGNYHFEEKYFYPVHGASQVLVRDFDVDGDLDMVVLAMYPDLFSWSEETIVYFENKGDLNFEPSYIEKQPSGKWLLMDAGDVDDDGDYDLILGTNYKVKLTLLPPEYKAKWDSGRISYAVFRNTHF